ncbi:MAG: PKD domain-containing protein [Candidatus Nanopelagicales bacterium]
MDRQWTVSRPVLAVGASLAMSVAMLAPITAHAAVSGNLVTNGEFTTGVNGWQATGGTLTHVSTNNVGEMVNSTAATTTLTLNDRANTVGATVAGRVYTVSGRARAVSVANTFQLRVQEWGVRNGAWERVGQAAQTQTLPVGGAWVPFSFTYTAVRTGYTLDLNGVAQTLPAKAVVQVDSLRISDAAGGKFGVNSEFDDSVNGWFMSTGGTLRAAAENFSPVSGPFARVARGATAGDVTLADQPRTVPSAVRGSVYRASAQVRSSALAGQRVTLRMQESADGSVVGQSAQAVTFNQAGWAPVSLTYEAKRDGSSLDLTATGTAMPAGALLDVDQVSVVEDRNEAPSATFAASTDFLDVSVDSAGSADPDGSLVAFAWDFGDGTTATGATAKHTYAAAGDFRVRLTVTDNRGGTATTDRMVTAVKPNEPPRAAFTTDSKDLKVSVDAGASSDPDGSVISYAWDFGDGSNAAGMTVAHTYATPGVYDVRLVVTDDRGATDSASAPVTAVKPNDPPKASFTLSPDRLTVTGDATASADPDGNVVRYAWDWGDGSTGTGAGASYTYAAAGTYEVRLTVTDDKGATDTLAKSVTVSKPNSPPKADLSVTTDARTATVDGTASSDPDGPIATYRWEWSDGAVDSGATAGHTFVAGGTYSVKLTVTDESGATDSATKSLTVGAPVPSGWKVQWADEFDAAGVDSANWSAYHNTYGDGNKELACLTPNNISTSGGVATITALRQTVTCPSGAVRNYTSGFLGSREAGRYHPLYGRYEIRAQIPHGQGLWPAFWLRHRNGASVAEVDILEAFHSQGPGRVVQTLHFPSSLGSNWGKVGTFLETPPEGTGGWHTFAVEIEPVSTGVRFRFFVDSTMTKEFVNTSPSAWNQVDPDAGWDIAVNLAVGGTWVGDPDKQLGYLPYKNLCSLTAKAPTNNDPSTCPTTGIHLANFPAKYNIDYVRVYTR